MNRDKDFNNFLHKCICDDHVLLTLFKNFKSDKSIKNRDRLNKGEKLTIDELKDLPYSEFFDEIKITDSIFLEYVIRICLEFGVDGQSMFSIEDVSYYTFFIEPPAIETESNEGNLLQFLEKIKKDFPTFWSSFIDLTNHGDFTFSVSFPMRSNYCQEL